MDRFPKSVKETHMAKIERRGYHIFPPHIDAYRSCYEEGKGITLKEFKEKMRQHATEWGEQSVGITVLETGEPPKVRERIVVVCGCWGTEKYVGMVPPKTHRSKDLDVWLWWELDIIKHEYPGEWDVT